MPGIKKSTKPVSIADKLNKLLKNQNAQAGHLYKLLHKGTSVAHVKAYYETAQSFNTYYREMRTRNLNELKTKLLERKVKLLTNWANIVKGKGIKAFVDYLKQIEYLP